MSYVLNTHVQCQVLSANSSRSSNRCHFFFPINVNKIWSNKIWPWKAMCSVFLFGKVYMPGRWKEHNTTCLMWATWGLEVTTHAGLGQLAPGMLPFTSCCRCCWHPCQYHSHADCSGSYYHFSHPTKWPLGSVVCRKNTALEVTWRVNKSEQVLWTCFIKPYL